MGGTRKLGAKVLVLGWIAGVDDVLTSRPEKLEERRRVIAIGRIDSRLDGLLGGGECSLTILQGGG